MIKDFCWPVKSCPHFKTKRTKKKQKEPLKRPKQRLPSGNLTLLVFPAGPQPRPSPPSVPCRTSTTTIHAQCSLPDLNRESTPSVPCRTSCRKICQIACQIECQKICQIFPLKMPELSIVFCKRLPEGNPEPPIMPPTSSQLEAT